MEDTIEYLSVIRFCSFCGKDISDNFKLIGLSIVCPYCNKPQKMLTIED